MEAYCNMTTVKFLLYFCIIQSVDIVKKQLCSYNITVTCITLLPWVNNLAVQPRYSLLKIVG